MADEDEIDILGDFGLDNFLSKNDSGMYSGNSSLVSQNIDILNCDYTVHPQWLLDKPNANPTSWYNDFPETFTSDLTSAHAPHSFELEQAPDAKDHSLVCTENLINDDSGWTEKEKCLLKRGIEIFGRSTVCLSQFIGSKSAAEIKHYLKHFYTIRSTCEFSGEFVICDNSVQECSKEIIEGNEIPVTVEEVIDTTINSDPKKNLKKSETLEKSESKNVHRVTAEDKKKKATSFPINKMRAKHGKSVKFKFKTKLDASNMKAARKKTVKRITKDESVNCDKKQSGEILLVTGNGLGVPICDGEQVVKIVKENIEDGSESDLEIDIEVTDDDEPQKENTLNLASNSENIKQELENHTSIETDESMTDNIDELKRFQSRSAMESINLSEFDASVAEQLKSMEKPQHEVILDANHISELEKVIHSEFFEGGPTKTALRYLKIRNHIINVWLSAKPNYVTKTSSRHGLKNCGDVNCIGRVHYYLEQIGAINFGCPQTSYLRPLYEMLHTNPVPVKEKVPKTVRNHPLADSLTRPRNKKKFANDGLGGRTLTHDETGEVINTIVVDEPPVKRNYIKRPSIKLMYCRPFNHLNPQKYQVRMDISTLILMDLHAHSSLSEVMGLIGGKWNPREKTLTISHYEPCKNVASSATHCDMCPVSQAKAADSIHNRGLDILGWFHSHPTFAPEPSQQDLDTQLTVQQWIGTNRPCLGVILAPFNLQGVLIASPFRCMVIERDEGKFVPFKFKVDVVSESLSVDKLVKCSQKIFRFVGDAGGVFSKEYFLDQNITYLDKFLSSVKMTLAKCGDINKMTCDAIIQGLTDLSYNIKE